MFDAKQKDQTELGFGTLEMPQLKDLKNSRYLPNSQIIAVTGIVRLNSDDVIRNSNEMNWHKCLKEDEKDFEEFKYSLNDEEVEYEDEISKLQTQANSPDHNTMFLNPSYYDV